MNEYGDVKEQLNSICSDIEIIVAYAPYISMQKNFARHANEIYKNIKNEDIKEQLIKQSVDSQTYFLSNDPFTFGRCLFTQIELLIKYYLCDDIGISKINQDLRSNVMVLIKKSENTLLNHIFGWRANDDRTDKLIINKIMEGKDITWEEIKYSEQFNLFYYYYFPIKSSPDWNSTRTLQNIRNSLSHGGIIDMRNELYKNFHEEYSKDIYLFAAKYYKHVAKFNIGFENNNINSAE